MPRAESLTSVFWWGLNPVGTSLCSFVFAIVSSSDLSPLQHVESLKPLCAYSQEAKQLLVLLVCRWPKQKAKDIPKCGQARACVCLPVYFQLPRVQTQNVRATPSCFQSSPDTVYIICFPGPSARQEPQIPMGRDPALPVLVVVSCLIYLPFSNLGPTLSAIWTVETAGSSCFVINWTLGNKMSTRLCLR